MSIRVVIADDHPMVRAGLRLTIERSGMNITIVGEAADGMEVLQLAAKKPSDVFILDITMPNLNGIEATRELLRRMPKVGVIILSLHDTPAMVQEALTSGARGYLTKETATQNVVDAVTEVHAGHYYLSPAITHFALEGGPTTNRGSRKKGAAPTNLTSQERKVLQLIAEGHSSKEIAAKLKLSVHTAHAHRRNLMAKLNLHRQGDLIRFAIKTGIAKV